MLPDPAASVARSSVWPLVIFTGLVWGFSGLASKWLINGGVDAFTVTAFPFLVAAVVAWWIAWGAADLRREALIAGVFLGSVNSAIPPLFFNIAYETLPAGLVTLILSLGPVITAGTAHFVFADERFNAQKGAGLLVAFGGVGLLVLAPGVIEGASYAGAVWTLAGACVAGTTAVLSRRFAMRHGARALVAPQLTAAGLTTVMLGLMVGRTMIPDGGFAATDLLVMSLIGIVGGYGGFRAIMIANESGTTGQVAMIAYIIPLVGVTGGIVFFSERLTVWVIAGAVLILTGVMLAGRASRPGHQLRSSA